MPSIARFRITSEEYDDLKGSEKFKDQLDTPLLVHVRPISDHPELFFRLDKADTLTAEDIRIAVRLLNRNRTAEEVHAQAIRAGFTSALVARLIAAVFYDVLGGAELDEFRTKLARSKGGHRTKKLSTPKEETWLKEAYAATRGKKSRAKHVAKQYCSEFNEKVTDATVRKRLRELGVWETA